jgi:hypothetical protein
VDGWLLNSTWMRILVSLHYFELPRNYKGGRPLEPSARPATEQRAVYLQARLMGRLSL